jgi:tight adherence protein C
MEALSLLNLVLLFLAVSLFTYGVCQYLNHRKVILDRFKAPTTDLLPLFRPKVDKNSWKERLMGYVSSFGQFASGDQKDTSGPSELRRKLIMAGFRHSGAVGVFYGLRAISALLLPLFYMLFIFLQGKVTLVNLSMALLMAAIGYFLPNYILGFIMRRRQDHIDRTLPDVLDLLVISLEAGLSLQATMNRVAEEIRPVSKELYKELQITNAELRTGIPREQALKNLGERTGVLSIKSLVALMVQSERMGVSIAQALRTHADFIRLQRGQRAEEIAAKMPIKIVFPTLLFIFPCLFIIILGPAAMQIFKTVIK